MAELLYIPQIAERFGLTEAAVRGHLQRATGVLPPSIKIGRKHAWRRATIDAWLAGKESEAEKRARGRPKR